MEVIETRTSRIWLGEDGIVRHVLILDNAVLTRADHEENVVAIARVSGGTKRPQLINIHKVKWADRESRQYGASEAVAEVVAALAILISSPVGTMIGNFWLKISKPSYPSKLFTSEAQAIDWLKDFLD